VHGHRDSVAADAGIVRVAPLAAVEAPCAMISEGAVLTAHARFVAAIPALDVEARLTHDHGSAPVTHRMGVPTPIIHGPPPSHSAPRLTQRTRERPNPGELPLEGPPDVLACLLQVRLVLVALAFHLEWPVPSSATGELLRLADEILTFAPGPVTDAHVSSPPHGWVTHGGQSSLTW
jgi:hypothetical protein